MDPNKPQVSQTQNPQPVVPSGPVERPGPSPLAEVPEASQPAPAPVEIQGQPKQPASQPQSQTPTPGPQAGTVPQTQEPPKQEGSGQ